MLKLINESRNCSDTELYAALIKEAKDKIPALKNVSDSTINKLLTIYAQDILKIKTFGRYACDALYSPLKKTILIDDFADWFNDAPVGETIIDFADKLPRKSIAELGKLDPKFEKALRKLYDEAFRLDKSDKKAKEEDLTYEELIEWLFVEGPKNSKYKFKDLEDQDIELTYSDDGKKDEYDKVEFDQEAFNIGVEELAKVYKQLHEDVEDVAILDTTKEDNNKFGFKDSLRGLTQNIWDNISYINSIIETAKNPENRIEESDDIIKILDSVADDLTIDLGMINKASEIIDTNNIELMDKGTIKAEKIISEE